MKPSLLNRICEDFGLSQADAWQLIWSAPRRYKVFPVKKRSGRGDRMIAQPARELKRLQRWLVSEVLRDLPVHHSCMAYVKGKGIRQNAQRHVASNFLLKMDFSAFFPSIVPSDFEAHLKKHSTISYSEQDVEVMSKLIFWQPNKRLEKYELCIGGPSSPIISNTILFDFDTEIANFCNSIGAVYTRYADDLTFSTNQPDILKAVAGRVTQLCDQLPYPRLKINHEKTVYTSKKHMRRVTGLILNNEGAVSLGRDRKRNISAMIHHYQLGKLEQQKIQKLRGLLAFANDVEPQFLARMRKKYGARTIRKILSAPFEGKQRD